MGKRNPLPNHNLDSAENLYWILLSFRSYMLDQIQELHGIVP